MTEWTVERDARGYSVVATRDGERVEPRRSLTGLACITARVLADELNGAYCEGVAWGERQVFARGLGD